MDASCVLCPKSIPVSVESNLTFYALGACRKL
jgi:hypothetical protein